MTASCPARRSPFASRSLAEHLARGALAVALAAGAVRFGDRSALVLPAALAGAVLLLRGCPTCWLVGLFGTMADRAAARADVRADASTTVRATVHVPVRAPEPAAPPAVAARG